MKINKRYKYLIIINCLLLQVGLSQPSETSRANDSQLWGDMTLTESFAEKWSIGGDFGLRSSLNNNNWWQFYIRPNINYELSPIYNFSFGLGTFSTFSSQAFNTWEFRIYQDANFNWPEIGFFNFQHRVRIEQRFFEYTEGIPNSFSVRGRYLLGVRTDNFSLGGQQSWNGFMSLEPFIPLGKESGELRANNFRWDTAIGHQIDQTLRIELHYILQSSDLFFLNSLSVVDHLFRLRVFKSL